MLQNRNNEICDLNARIHHLEDTICQYKNESNSQKDKNEELSEQLEKMEADLIAIQLRFDEKVQHAHDLKEESEKLEEILIQAVKDKEGWLSKIEQLEQAEEKAFNDSEEARSALEKLTEAKLLLDKELDHMKSAMEQLQRENERLVGHQNQRQKIQLHHRIKQENNELKQHQVELEHEIDCLKKRFKRMDHNKENSSPNIAEIEREYQEKRDLEEKWNLAVNQIGQIEDWVQKLAILVHLDIFDTPVEYSNQNDFETIDDSLKPGKRVLHYCTNILNSVEDILSQKAKAEEQVFLGQREINKLRTKLKILQERVDLAAVASVSTRASLSLTRLSLCRSSHLSPSRQSECTQGSPTWMRGIEDEEAFEDMSQDIPLHPQEWDDYEGAGRPRVSTRYTLRAHTRPPNRFTLDE